MKPEHGKTYQLAGSFPSQWRCLAIGDGHTALMENMKTKEVRRCWNPEIDTNGKISWSSSRDWDPEEWTWTAL